MRIPAGDLVTTGRASVDSDAGTASGGWRRPGGLLWQRNFRLLWTGETISGAGNAMAVVGMPLLAVTVLHASTLTVAALTAAAYVPWLVIGLPAGAWVDQLPTRALMIVCDVVSALLYASLPTAAWLGILRIPQVVIVALLAGGVNVLFATAYQVCLPLLVAPEELVEGNAKLQGSAQVAAIAGRSGAGVAAEVIGAANGLLFNAASFVVSAVCLLRIRLQQQAPRSERPASVRLEIWKGIKFVSRDPYLRPLTLYPAIANFAYTGNLALVVVFLVRVVGLSSADVGLLTAAGGTGGVLGAVLARKLAYLLGTARTLVVTSMITGTSGLLIPLTGPGLRIAYYVVGSALVASGIVVANVIVAAFWQEYCPPEMLGRVTATVRFLVYGTVPLGALVAGILGTVLGARDGLWAVLASLAVSGSVLLSSSIRKTRNLPGAAAAGRLQA